MFKKYTKHIESNLEKYDVLFTAKEFITMKVFGLLVGLTVGATFAIMTYMQHGILATSTVIGVGFSVIGHLTPNMWVYSLSNKRKKMLESQLEETLADIKDRFEKENDLMKAVQMVASEKNYPINNDLNRLYQEKVVSNTPFRNIEEIREQLKKRA